MAKETYMIKKTLLNNGDKVMHVFMTDGNSQVLEMKDFKTADKFVEIMNQNTDSGCIYEIITVKNYKN